jgi:PAS domain S-box-containing protein
MATRKSGRHNCIDATQMLPGANKNQTEYLLEAPFGASCWSRAQRPVHELLVLLGILFFIVIGSHASAQAHTKNILILYSFNDDSVFGPVDLLKASLRARVPDPIDFYVESFEHELLDDESYQESMAATLRHVLQKRKLDLVMVGAYPALQFALQHRDELFPGVPIVFFAVESRRLAGQKLWPGVTGVTSHIDFGGTIDLAFKLQPSTSSVALITTGSKFDRYWLTVIHGILKQTHAGVPIVDLAGLPMDQLVDRVAALPSGAVVLFGIDPKHSIQPAIGVWDVLVRVGQLRPTYCAVPPDGCLSHGGIGGTFYDVEEQNSLAAQIAARILSGEHPENIPVADGGPSRYYLSWPAMRRWNIPESALPVGSVIVDREPTLWERGRKYFLLGIAVIVAQALLIFGLLWQRARKRKAESVLRESEERFRVMADTTPSLVWMCDAQGKITYLNEQRLAFTGPDPNAGYGDTWITYIHPDDVKNVLDTLWQALRDQKPFSKEYRLHRSDGTYRWMFDVASPRVNGDGSFAGFIGSAIDVTDQKLAQRALEQISGQLIEAQEKERTRIARDLHDDICQRLALLSMELEQAKSVSKGRVEATRSLETARQHCSEIAGDVQSLSHQLHSSKLDFLGIVTAIRGFCKEFSKQNSVSVEFTDRQLPKHLPKDISLCLFRVAQEALHNAVKYSGTTRFTVELSATADEVQLQVTDAGAGFDLEQMKNRGLGLVSMQERVHQVHGKFSVESKPGKGTKIIAIVPLAPENRQVSEDGVAKDSASALEPV